MRIVIKGNVRERERFARFSSSVDVLDSASETKRSLSVSDTYLLIDEIGSDYVQARFFFFDKETSFRLCLGETYTLNHEGNAFGFRYEFTLEV